MLVGRQAEQRTVEALISAARIGQSAVLVLTGEAGIGKTALLEHALTCTADMRVLRVTGSDSEQHLPFAGLAQLLRVTPADLDALPPPQAQALGVALALRPGDGVDRFAVGAAALTLLTQASENRPLAVVVDDAHLVDRPSQEALAFVMRRLLADAVVVLAAARSGEPCLLVADDLPRHRLTGLDLASATDLVLSTQDPAAGRALADRVAALAEGNPLALIELAGDRSSLALRWPDAPGQVPASLTGLYAARASALEPAARQVLLLAATAGEDLLLIGRACAAAGLDVAHLVAAERLGLIRVGPDRVRFAHPLTRAAICSTAPADELRRLHAAVASVVPAADVDRRAWHHSEAAFGPDPEAADGLERLAERAVGRGAFSVAATAYERAARLSTDEPERARRALHGGDAAWRAGDGPLARSLLDSVLLLAPDTLTAVEARRLLAVVAARSGSVAEAREGLRAGAALAVRLGSAAHALACQAQVVHVCFYLGDAAGALTAATEAEALLTGGLTRAETAVATMAAGMGRVLAGAGGPDLIRRGIELLEAAAPVPAVPDESSWAVMGPLFLREAGTGRRLVRSAIDDQRAKAAVGTLPQLLFHIARDEATTDQWSRAEADYGEAVALAAEFGQTTELAMSSAGLAWLTARQGRRAQTQDLAAVAERLGSRHEVHLARVWAGHALADLAAGLGEIDVAIASYARVADLLDALGVSDVDLSPVPEQVEALVHAGRTRDAEALAEPFGARAAAKGQPWALARAARVRGLLCADDQVDGTFGAAFALHAGTLDDYEQARTRLAYGARLRRARRRIDARRQLQQALDAFGALGALPWADRAAQELVATGATARRTGAGPSSQLTPRELQIALLLADGSTVRDAAASLFLSPKTVEYHLRHVYTKWQIGSRAELAVRMSSLAGRE